jgi:polyisoprenoid-binding protein YceI
VPDIVRGVWVPRFLVAQMLAAAAWAATGQQLVPAQSEVTFTSRQMGVPVDGRFTRFDARVTLDPKHVESGRVTISIDTGSVRFGAPETDAEVAKPAWFHVAKFGQATFESTSIKALGGGRYDVAGTLTIKGRARELVVLVTLATGTPHAVASGSFTLKRLDFALGEGEWGDTSLVANDVQVRFKLALAGLPPT